LVDDIEADGAGEFINVWVKYSVDEADARALVWILIGQLDVDLPETTLKGSLYWALESDIELLLLSLTRVTS